MNRSIPYLHKLTDAPDSHLKGGIFTVVAERWGDRYNHCYLVGSYKTLQSALHNANKEAAYRGGKYGCRIYCTRHPNQHEQDRMVEIYEIRSPYHDRTRRVAHK